MIESTNIELDENKSIINATPDQIVSIRALIESQIEAGIRFTTERQKENVFLFASKFNISLKKSHDIYYAVFNGEIEREEDFLEISKNHNFLTNKPISK